MTLKTKNLIIIPLKTEQMRMLSADDSSLFQSLGVLPPSSADAHLSNAYAEMYQSCLEHPNDVLWYTAWLIILKSEKQVIGSIGFFGPVNDCLEVTVGYGIDENFRGHGYAAEALNKVAEWAFCGKPYYIRAEVEPDNEASKKVLDKCGFKTIDDSGENLIYELERPCCAWVSVYMCLGMCFGMSLGIMFGNMMLGMCIGIAIGVAVGNALDAEDKKKRKRK